ncbi:hypothetical protein M8375_35435, partial [Klebsiella pneumoniae]|nr:hypothetical protein [Klebsiella pneumoniae]
VYPDVSPTVFTHPSKNTEDRKVKPILASFYKRQEKISAKNPSNGQNKMKQSRRGINAEKSG